MPWTSAAVAAATTAGNAESARAAVHAADVALARVEAIHAKIEDAHAKIFQATSDSSMQPTSEKAVVAMEHLLPYEVTEQELEMQDMAKIKERREEELRVAEVDVEKSLSVEESGWSTNTSSDAATTTSTTTLSSVPRTRKRTRLRCSRPSKRVISSTSIRLPKNRSSPARR